jgi:antirestriction protein ArdC
MEEAGNWDKPWFGNGMPFNPISKHDYRGFNVFYLELWAMKNGYTDPRWITVKQMNEKGGKFKGNAKGKGAMISFWKPLIKPDPANPSVNKIVGMISRYYTVFNIEEVEGIDFPEFKRNYIDFKPVDAAEDVIKNYKGRPQILHGATHAFYAPLHHQVQMPDKKMFKSIEEYYATLFHELIHSTGHKSLLNRLDSIDYTSELGDRSKEELTAELGSALLCGVTGIKGTEKNSAAYLKNWLSAIKNDMSLLSKAGSDAQKALDCILGTSFANEEN